MAPVPFDVGTQHLQILWSPLTGRLTTNWQGFAMMNTNGESDSPPGY